MESDRRVEDRNVHEKASVKPSAANMPRHRQSPVPDAASLIELHEQLLFRRAYPRNQGEVTETESRLKRIASRVARLQDSDIDLSPLDAPEVSGIAGTSVTSNFSYVLVRWLVSKFPN